MSDRALRRATAALALAGAGISGYLAYARLADASVVCATGGCETVQESDYAQVAGIPVAVLGLVAYVAILGLVALDGPRARAAAAGIALAGLAFSAYLLVVQLLVIHALCSWCLANDVVIALLAAVTALRSRSSGPGGAGEARSAR